MVKLGLVLILTMMTIGGYAQDAFVLIQADHRQPFYVRVGDEQYNSSAEGHLILSRLKDSTYNVTIGLPGQASSEQRYSITIRQKDQEFLLKSFGDKGWTLYDVQAQTERAVDKNKEGGVEEFKSVGTKKEDAFSRMMAGVVRDTAVLYNTYAAQQTLTDSPAVAQKPAAAPPAGTSLSQRDSSIAGTATRPARTDSSVSQDSSVLAQTNATSPGSAVKTGVAIPAGDSTLTTGVAASTTGDSASRDTARSLAGAPLYRPIAARPVILSDSAASNPVKSDSTASGSVTDSGTAGRPPGLTKTDSFRVVAQTDSSLTLQAVSIIDTVAGRTPGSVKTPATEVPVTSSVAEKSLGATDSAVTKGTTPLYRPIVKPAKNVSTGPLYRPLGVTKVSERKLTHSLRQVYADHLGSGKADTIVVIIPVDSPVVARAGTSLYRSRSADTSRVGAPRSHGPNPDSPIVGQSTAYRTDPRIRMDTPRTHPDTPKKEPARPVPFVNSDCHNFATDYDVDKLRVRMLESAQDEDRIVTARKVFKTRCFSTRQLRALSEVFTSDAAKFHFFEAAYPFAADDHFRDLGPLLADPVYNNKFKLMTGQ